MVMTPALEEHETMHLAGVARVRRNSFTLVTRAEERSTTVPPVNETLTRVVLLARVLGWAWMLALTLTTLSGARFTADGPNVAVLTGAIALATFGTALMVLASRRGFMGALWYVLVDGVMTVVILAAGWLAGAPDFVAGGLPMSWIFLAAYATNLRGTIIAASLLTAIFAWLHVIMGLDTVRVVGSVQFLVVGLIVSWAFDALRQRERLRLEAEAQRAIAEEALAAEREKAARLEERSTLARRLHDSVLQTLKLIMSNSGDADEVRYLARVQERELRRTINEYRSPYENSFRSRLLDSRAEVEDRYRVEIEQVIRGDMEMTASLEALIEATHEAMTNAARHSGMSSIDLFADIGADGIQVNVRDRGRGFDCDSQLGNGITHSILAPIEQWHGRVSIKSTIGFGTDVSLFLPSQ